MQTLVDITLDNAQSLLIDESFKRIVVVDFWADWCAPCKALMPVLEKIANEYQGAFLLAKVNADEQNMIASQFGVRSLPTVILIKDGQPLDGFTGAKSEIEVRELLATHLPKTWEPAFAEAQALINENNPQAALPILRQVYEESGQLPEISLYLAQVLVELNRLDEAENLLANVKMVDQSSLYEQVKSQLELKQQASKTPELEALEQAHAKAPEDLTIAYQLALQLNLEQRSRDALEILLTILKKDRQFNEGAVRKSYTDILTSLGKGDPLAIEFQRKLFTLLY